MTYGILYDSTRCAGCGVCLEACKLKNRLPEKDQDRLCENTFTVLEEHGGHPIRRMCMHCNEPACASVCPVGALEKTKEGPVVYHADKCMGCRYCLMACPFDIPKYEWDSAVPRVRKCQMCFDRVERGRAPACAMFCGLEGIKFGPREELLAEARNRLQAEPDRYHQHIYGENEVGGTAVLILTAVPPEKMGLPVGLPGEPMPERTWQVLSRLPGVVAAGGAFLAGMAWLIGRRNRLMQEEPPAPERAVAAPEREKEEVLQ